MGCIVSGIAELDELQIQARDLVHDLLERVDRAGRIRVQQSLREQNISVDGRDRLAQLEHDGVTEVDLGVLEWHVHRCPPDRCRVITTTRVSGSSDLSTRAIAAPEKDGMSSSMSATSGRSWRRS